MVDGPDAEFTLDDFKALQRAPSRPQTQGSRRSTAGRKPRSPTDSSPGGKGESPRSGLPGSAGPASNRPGTNASAAVVSASGSRPLTFGRLETEAEHEEQDGIAALPDGNPFFKVPIPVVWVASEDAAYISEDTMASIYWHDGLPVEGEPQPVPKATSMQGLATIQKRLQETDPDLHAKQLSALTLEMRAKDAMLSQRDDENRQLQEKLSSALRELKEAREEHR